VAQYRVIADCYVLGGYAFAGSVLDDSGGVNTIPIPVGWRPSAGAVDPISSDAINAYWNEGPRGMNDAEPNRWNYPWGWFRFTGVAYAPAVHYWRSIGGGQFVLNGAENLGPKAGT
jgi:hypothetical protein